MRIGIDCDDVIADFQTTFITLAHNTYGRPPLGTHPIDWEWSNSGLSKDEIGKLWGLTREVEDFWYNLKPLPSLDNETLELLQKADEDHDVWFITNRYDTVGLSPLAQTKCWIQWHTYVGIPNVLIAAEKGPVAQILKLDAFFDDRPKNCEEVKAAMPSARVYLADSSHNQTYNHPDIPRLANLKAFLKVIL